MCICSRDDRVARECFVGSQLNCYFSQSDIFFLLLLFFLLNDMKIDGNRKKIWIEETLFSSPRLCASTAFKRIFHTKTKYVYIRLFLYFLADFFALMILCLKIDLSGLSDCYRLEMAEWFTTGLFTNARGGEEGLKIPISD